MFGRRIRAWICTTTVCGATSCGGTPPPPPAPPSPAPDLVRRHYDQVCNVAWGETPTLRLAELFDTDGLIEQLTALGIQSLGPHPTTGRLRWGSADVISRYAADGIPRMTGVWESTLEPHIRGEVQRIMSSRARRLPALLTEEGFRTVVTLSPRPTVRVAEPVACLPHMRHPRGARPEALPEGVSISREYSSFRLRPGRTVEPGQAWLRVHFTDSGRIDSIAPVGGSEAAITAARTILGRLTFDPALRNGEGVAETTIFAFRFRPEAMSRLVGGRRIP